MSRLIRRTLSAIFVALFFAHSILAASTDTQPALDEMHSSLIAAVKSFERNLDTPRADGTVRAYTYAAHYALAVGLDPKIAQNFIDRAMARQNMDPHSPKFGDIPWQMFANDINDANSVEFTFDSMGAILLRYSDRLSPQFKAQLIPHIAGGIAAIHRHKVPVSYTNIYLMKTENLLLLGDAIADQRAIADGRDQLDTWLQYTATHGIHEYSSPTYAATQLNCLLEIYRNTRLPDVKRRVKTALDYLWSDAATSFIAPGNTMAGPHSREYDFLRGEGSIDRFYELEGLRNGPALSSLFDDAYAAYLNIIENGYRPSEDILAVAHSSERVIKAKWDDGPGQDRYTYITPDFAVGSTSAYYGPQDREVAVDFSSTGSADPVSMTLSADTFDAPYGKVKLKDRSGHDKPFRLRTNIATVQDHGAVLALLDLSPDLSRTPLQSLATDMLIPLTADQIVLDGQSVALPEAAADAEAASPKTGPSQDILDQLRDWSLPAHRDSVLGIRCGNAGVAVRIFAADGVDHQSPQYALKCDGAQWGAGRLVVYQYQGTEKKITQKPIRAGVLILCARCTNETELTSLMESVRKTKIEQSRDDNAWDVRAAAPGIKSLEAALDLQSGHPSIRRVGNTDFQPDLFSVNGRDLAAGILVPLADSR
jgi:hypothetical protein